MSELDPVAVYAATDAAFRVHPVQWATCRKAVEAAIRVYLDTATSKDASTQPVGEARYAYCQPTDKGVATPRQFIVRYADQDVPDAVFDDEGEAYEFWHRANIAWTCWLFGTMPYREPAALATQATATEETT